MKDHNLTFGWFLPTFGDTTAFADPSKRIDASPELFDDVVDATENGGFHYMLMPVSPTCWEASVLASYYVARTKRISPLVAIRAGYCNPTHSAKVFATLDRMSRGRICLNLIAGLNDKETEADGITDSKVVRYEKMDEEVSVMKRLWTNDKPAPFEGKHFHVSQVIEPKPVQKPYPPFFLGGGSEQAAEISAKHSTVHLFWGDKPSVIADNVKRMRGLAAKYNREDALGFGMRLQVVCRDSEEEAWDAAHELIAGYDPLKVMPDLKADAKTFKDIRETSAANRRVWELLEAAGANMRIHPHLWAGISTVRPGAGIALVGNPKQIADTMEEFIAAGCTSFCLSGYPHAGAARIFSEKVMRPYFGSRMAAEIPRAA